MPGLTKKQVFAILISIGLIGVLLSLDLVPPDTRAKDSGKTPENTEITLEGRAEEAKKGLSEQISRLIADDEDQLRSLKGSERLPLLERLAFVYDSLGKFDVTGFYYEEIASLKNEVSEWVRAGNNFMQAYRATNDSVLAPGLLERAGRNYKTALDADPKNLEARTGMGVYYVEGSENPMQGITLLREVVNEDPDNVPANFQLGLFSMRSGQYDKAVSRFKTLVSVQPSAEHYAYLAEAYERLGNKQEAIIALKKAKEYVIDPAVLKGIEQYIQTLSNK